MLQARGEERTDNDEGAALIVVLVMLALIGALTMTLAVITTGNLASARAAQQSGSALNASDAGISQGVTYLRTEGVVKLNKCSPNCTDNPWGSKNSPASVTVGGRAGQSYKVWIEPLQPYPQFKPGTYRIHSKGEAGGSAARSVTADVALDSYKIPFGISAKSINGGGNAGVHQQSIFTTGCVYGRSKIRFEGIDAAYGQPAAVHSSQIITDSQGSGQFCPQTGKPIHRPAKGSTPGVFCNPLYPYDQDKNGGPLAGTSCQGAGGAYPQTSLLNSEKNLFETYKMQQPTLTQSQIDSLRSIAQAQNNYHTESSGWTSPVQDNAVMFFDLLKDDPGGLVDLNDILNRGRDVNLLPEDVRCTATSLVVVIEGGNVRLNSNQILAASVFLTSDDPYGNVFKANGTATFIGTLYANNIDLTGTADLYLDKCFLSNISPALFNVDVRNYREIDR